MTEHRCMYCKKAEPEVSFRSQTSHHCLDCYRTKQAGYRYADRENVMNMVDRGQPKIDEALAALWLRLPLLRPRAPRYQPLEPLEAR